MLQRRYCGRKFCSKLFSPLAAKTVYLFAVQRNLFSPQRKSLEITGKKALQRSPFVLILGLVGVGTVFVTKSFGMSILNDLAITWSLSISVLYVVCCCRFDRGGLSRSMRISIANILSNTSSYYSQFQPTIAKYLGSQKSPIEEKLSELVKLSKWDLSNYWSLKESAVKSHRKLTKLAREWESVLQVRLVSSHYSSSQYRHLRVA